MQSNHLCGRQFQSYLRIEMVITDLLSSFFTILYHILDYKMVYDRFLKDLRYH